MHQAFLVCLIWCIAFILTQTGFSCTPLWIVGAFLKNRMSLMTFKQTLIVNLFVSECLKLSFLCFNSFRVYESWDSFVIGKFTRILLSVVSINFNIFKQLLTWTNYHHIYNLYLSLLFCTDIPRAFSRLLKDMFANDIIVISARSRFFFSLGNICI